MMASILKIMLVSLTDGDYYADHVGPCSEHDDNEDYADDDDDMKHR